jgi:2,3-bisphosphoglycerate-dependent phosphoglycerate mutase
MSKLIVARHHESAWNKLGVWTGLRDIHMTPYGFEKAHEMGTLVKHIPVDYAFSSMLVRTIETLSSMLNAMEQYKVPAEHTHTLNERDYGDLTGKNKWEIEKKVGKEEFTKLRRDWNHPVPGGETLKMVQERALPFFNEKILPLLKKDKNVIIASHGNTIRSLVKHFENIPDDEIKNFEIGFGTILVYEFDKKGKIIGKEVFQAAVDVKTNA